MRGRHGLEVEVGEQDFLGALSGPGHHSPVGRADKALPRERQPVLWPHAVDERREVAILKGRHLELRFVESVRPLAHCACLGYHNDLGTGDRERTHGFGVVSVVANRDANFACGGVVHRQATISGCVVTLLVKRLVVGDVDHPGPAQQPPVGIEDGGRVEGPVSVALEQVQNGDHATRTTPLLKRADGRPVDRFGGLEDGRGGMALWVERRECELCEGHHVGSVIGRSVEGLEAAREVVLEVVGGGLLDEGDAHG